MHNLSKNFMLRAIELSMISLKEDGGPFGCVIVKNNEIIRVSVKTNSSPIMPRINSE